MVYAKSLKETSYKQTVFKPRSTTVVYTGIYILSTDHFLYTFLFFYPKVILIAKTEHQL